MKALALLSLLATPVLVQAHPLDEYNCKNSRGTVTVNIQRDDRNFDKVSIAFGTTWVLVDYVRPFRSALLKDYPVAYQATKDHHEPYALEITIADLHLNFVPFRQRTGTMLLNMRDEYSSTNYPKPIVSNKIKQVLTCTLDRFVP